MSVGTPEVVQGSWDSRSSTRVWSRDIIGYLHVILYSKAVQRWVKLNPGLNKIYNSNCFSQENITVLIRYFSDVFLDNTC